MEYKKVTEAGLTALIINGRQAKCPFGPKGSNCASSCPHFSLVESINSNTHIDVKLHCVTPCREICALDLDNPLNEHERKRYYEQEWGY
jgi:hypothetical protein